MTKKKFSLMKKCVQNKRIKSLLDFMTDMVLQLILPKSVSSAILHRCEMVILKISNMIGSLCVLWKTNSEVLNLYLFQLISIYGRALQATEERVKELKSQQK